MSQPPVDPWSGQPEHDTHYDFDPPRPDGYPPPSAGGWTPPHGGQHPSGGQPSPGGGWPATPQPGLAPTQPYSGPPAQPHPTQPYSGPPAQPHPTQPYGGYPATPQAGFPTSPYAGYPPTSPGAGQPARSHQLVLTLGLVGLLVLCLGGGGIAFLAYEGEQDADPRPTPTASPTVAASSATPSAAPSSEAAPSPESSDAPQIRVVTPETLGGRSKSTEPTLRKAADDMVRELRSSVRGETGVAGAFYGSADKRDMVMVIAASTFVLNPERELDDAVKGISKDLAVKRLTTIAPGPLGGQAKCGDGESAGVPLGVCAWADHGSVGIIVMFFSSSAATAAEFVALRGQIEQRY
ncbi:hypothetical protein KBX06_10710 [Micromonospora sp. C31]|uniref:hypothetical protein n=1 Tax=Micromonospora sp. C31 TaxID=2824876 RepID=UPI001B36DB1F|nr:hypothetical protein [Micromonospora sp. C31]MBQ1073624.1 hypothetical protein [Micromonospora sp. C31]